MPRVPSETSAPQRKGKAPGPAQEEDQKEEPADRGAVDVGSTCAPRPRR